MAEPTNTKLSGPYAVMFADIGASASVYASSGNAPALERVRVCVEALAEITARHEGRLIKTIGGDHLLCVFPSGVKGALAASEMQRRSMELGAEDPAVTTHGLALRVGLHLGLVLDEGDDVYGDTVNTAARIVSLCKPEQLLATEQLVEALPDVLRSVTRFVDEVELRGKSERFRVYEIITEVSAATMTTDGGPRLARSGHTRCTLTHQGEVIELGDDVGELFIGRSAHVGLRCNGQMISREHAHIEYRSGRFVLVDHSANGTFLRRDGDNWVVLRNDHFTLDGSGIFALGQRPDEDDGNTIAYVCE